MRVCSGLLKRAGRHVCSGVLNSLTQYRHDPPPQPPAALAGSPIRGEAAALAATGGVPLELVARCARNALAAVRAACDDGAGGWDAERVELATWLSVASGSGGARGVVGAPA